MPNGLAFGRRERPAPGALKCPISCANWSGCNAWLGRCDRWRWQFAISGCGRSLILNYTTTPTFVMSVQGCRSDAVILSLESYFYLYTRIHLCASDFILHSERI